MKKWNILNLMMNENSIPSFSYDIIGQDEDGNNITLCSDQDFRTIILSKYFTTFLLTPSYYDTVQNSHVELCNDINTAISFLHSVFSSWSADRIPGFMKLYDALRGDYNPLGNYTKHIDSTTEYKGKETETETPSGTETETYTPSGTETDTLTKSGKEKETETPSGTETETTAKSGTETNTHNSGLNNTPHVTTLAKTSYDSATFKDAERTTEDSYSDNDVTSFADREDTKTRTFNQRKTESELEFTNRQDTNVKSFTNRKDETVKSFTNRKTETEKSFTDRKDVYSYDSYGNTGTYSFQKMILEQFNVTNADDLAGYIVNLFVHENLIY